MLVFKDEARRVDGYVGSFVDYDVTKYTTYSIGGQITKHGDQKWAHTSVYLSRALLDEIAKEYESTGLKVVRKGRDRQRTFGYNCEKSTISVFLYTLEK